VYEGLNEKQNQNHAISTSKNELFFVIVPKIVKSKKKAFFPIFPTSWKNWKFSRKFFQFFRKSFHDYEH